MHIVMATLKKKENDMFTSLFPNKSHNIQMEPTPPDWRLSSEAEVLHLEMEADLAAPCGSLVVVVVVVVVVLDVQRAVLLRGRLYEASMARRSGRGGRSCRPSHRFFFSDVLGRPV